MPEISARRISLSILTLLIAFCIGFSLIAAAGAAVFYTEGQSSPVEVLPAP